MKFILGISNEDFGGFGIIDFIVRFLIFRTGPGGGAEGGRGGGAEKDDRQHPLAGA